MSNKKPYEIHTINGLKVVFYPIKGLPAIKANLLIRAGSSYEDGEKWGAFHYIEHLCFQQTKMFKDWLELELYKEEFGLNNNAATGRERISYWTYGPNSSLKQSLILLHELTFNTLLPESAFAKEISIITQEFHDKWDSPYSRFGFNLDKQIFGDNHRYVRDGMGQPEFIKTLNRDDLVKLHQEYFTNTNSVLSVTGDFDVTESKKIISELFTTQGKESFITPHIQPQPVNKQLLHYEDVQQDRPVLRWPLPGFLDLTIKDRLALWIAGYILGGSSRSLVHQRLREELHLVYRSGASRQLSPHAGYFELWSSNSPEHTQKVVNEMRQLIYKFIEEPIGSKIYSRSLNFLKSNISLSFDSIHNISDDVTSDLFWENNIRLPVEEIKILTSIKESDVRKILGTFIKPEFEYLGVMSKNKNLKIT